MTKRILLFCTLCLSTLGAAAQTESYDSDFGTWWDLGAKKDLSRRWSLGLDGELRLDDNSTRVDRMGLGISASFKINKYLKIGAGYTALNGYSAEKTKIAQEEYTTAGTLLSYRERITEGHWTNRHRFYFEVTPDYKFGKAWHLSLRERYQYTVTPLQHYDRQTNYYELEDGEYVLDDEISYNEKRTTDRADKHVLRSRLKLEYDKKKLDWKPFVSIEAQNNLRKSWHMRKLRASAGTDYKINRHHSIGAAYAFTRSNEDGDKDLFHAINISYNYKF